MVIKFEQFNESIRDLMTPKSTEDIKKSMEKMYDSNEMLMFGVENNIDWVVKEAIEKGADVNLELKIFGNTMSDLFYSLLQYACYKGYTDIVKLLLDAGAVKELDDNLALRASVAHGHDEIIKLLKITKNINESVRDQMTPKSDEDVKQSLLSLSEDKLFDKIVWTIQRNDLDLLEFVHKFDLINVRNIQKETPLMEVCKSNWISSKMVKKLVKDYGADMNLKDKSDRTALMYAADADNLKVIKMLISLGVDIKKHNQGSRAVIRAVGKQHDFEMIESLLHAEAKVDFFDHNHSTALIYASLQSRKKVVELLFSKGANVNAQNENGMSPLMMAASRADKEVLNILLDAGADINMKNNNRQTATDIARAWDKKDNYILLRNYIKENQ